ncbi:protein kintoun-like, partial [Brachionichthys hirsutus]|uniref:protein kintoun-like n=1 Tax=Brachionichthys hirsutus TaxID=412623 RepID=UPI0036051504
GGRRWTLPHFLHPGRPERDPKGNKMVIYDVVFHPETLHMANRRASFMDVVASTAMQGIQSSFDVTLDENNASESSASYKGTPRPCVIRGPVPGYEEKKRPMEEPDPLAFPYPDEKPTIGQAATTKPPETRSRGAAPTRPSHAVKYRSSTDVQDFARSGDAIRGCRPKEIVVTVDLPLLRAARDASLEVREGRLLLESKEPAYRLELPLAYPVDEDEGAATFDKERRRLTVTLPVVPSRPGALDFAAGPAETRTGDDERQEAREAVGEGEEQRGEGEEEEEVKDERHVEEGQGREKASKGSNGEDKEEEDLEEAANGKRIQENVEEEKEKDVGDENAQKRQKLEDRRIVSDVPGDARSPSVPATANQEARTTSDEEDIPTAQSPEPENGPPSILREMDKHGNEKVISDHSTSAGFTFQNALMYELD